MSKPVNAHELIAKWRKVAADLEAVASVAWDFLDALGDRGTLPTTRPDLMERLQNATEAYEEMEAEE